MIVDPALGLVVFAKGRFGRPLDLGASPPVRGMDVLECCLVKGKHIVIIIVVFVACGRLDVVI